VQADTQRAAANSPAQPDDMSRGAIDIWVAATDATSRDDLPWASADGDGEWWPRRAVGA
jgi:hypothetical protein